MCTFRRPTRESGALLPRVPSVAVTDTEASPGADDGLARLAAAFDEAIRPGPYDLTLDDVADAAGVDPAFGRRLWRAMGFADPVPTDRIGTALDVTAFRRAMEQVDSLGGLERLVRQTRVISAAVARIAEVWVDDIRALLDEDLSPDEVPKLILPYLDLDRLTWLLGYVHRHQLQAAIRRELSARLPGRDGTMRTVGFADMVGFSALTRQHGASAMASFVQAFEQLVYDTVAGHGARLVKTIGDEVMFAAADTESAVAIASALSEGRRQLGIPQMRAGLDLGSAFWFEGDLYGPAVNVASRAVAAAPPGVVAVTRAVRDAHPEGGTWPSLGIYELKGFGATELWAAHTAG